MLCYYSHRFLVGVGKWEWGVKIAMHNETQPGCYMTTWAWAEEPLLDPKKGWRCSSLPQQVKGSFSFFLSFSLSLAIQGKGRGTSLWSLGGFLLSTCINTACWKHILNKIINNSESGWEEPSSGSQGLTVCSPFLWWEAGLQSSLRDQLVLCNTSSAFSIGAQVPELYTPLDVADRTPSKQ